MRKKLTTFAVAIAVAASLSACGSDDTNDAQEAAEDDPVAAEHEETPLPTKPESYDEGEEYWFVNSNDYTAKFTLNTEPDGYASYVIDFAAPVYEKAEQANVDGESSYGAIDFDSAKYIKLTIDNTNGLESVAPPTLRGYVDGQEVATYVPIGEYVEDMLGACLMIDGGYSCSDEVEDAFGDYRHEIVSEDTVSAQESGEIWLFAVQREDMPSLPTSFDDLTLNDYSQGGNAFEDPDGSYKQKWEDRHGTGEIFSIADAPDSVKAM